MLALALEMGRIMVAIFVSWVMMIMLWLVVDNMRSRFLLIHAQDTTTNTTTERSGTTSKVKRFMVGWWWWYITCDGTIVPTIVGAIHPAIQ